MEIIGVALFLCVCLGLFYLGIIYEDKARKRRQKEYWQNFENTLTKVLNNYSEQFIMEDDSLCSK